MKPTPEIRGYIGHYGLAEWWQETFTADEKEYIVDRCRRYHSWSGPDSLLEGDVFISTIKSTRPSTVSDYLNNLISRFRKPGENTILVTAR